VRGQAWSEHGLAELRQRWGKGETGAAIAQRLGRSRCAILGKVHSLGLRRWPKGCSEVPAHMLHDGVAGTLGIPAPDDSSPEFRTAMILISPMFVGWSAKEMARWTGYPMNECVHVNAVMLVNGIWAPDNPGLGRYTAGDGQPGLQIGDMSLVLDTLLCLGRVQCTRGGEMWYSAEGR
jgi:hypothetical protein